MKKKYKYIHFEQIIIDGFWNMDGFWNCINNKHKTVLGVVSYYTSWRQYVFNAEDASNIFSQDCLEDIVDFMKQLNSN